MPLPSVRYLVMATNTPSKHTGQSYDKIIAETERDHYMDVEEAKAYGLIDEVLDDPKKTKS